VLAVVDTYSLLKFFGVRARRRVAEHATLPAQLADRLRTGLLARLEKSLGYHFWVVYAIAGFATSFVVGAGYIGPQSGKLAKQIDAEGPDSPAVEARIGRILLAARADVLIPISIVFMMVTKVGQ
jgi:hypothetical protein